MGETGKPHALRIGEELVVESRPAEPPFWVVFEDDGDTGYLYALDARRGDDDAIFDALHVYDVDGAGDGPHELRLSWSDDEAAVVLTIDGRALAMVDFAEPRLMCRSGFPPPGGDSPVETHEWDAEALARRFPQLAAGE